MAGSEETVVWLFEPSFPLAVLASILYGLIFLALFYLTVIKYRAWYFTCVVVGAAIEVVGYAMRSYSAKFQTMLVRYKLLGVWMIPKRMREIH
jgi:ABC-type uncharacterized transport system permease subunit